MSPRLLFLIPLALAAQPPLATYYVGFLRAGPSAANFSADELKQLQAAHMKHIGAMAGSGALVGAGPMLSSPSLRGIFIFKTASLAAASELASADPMVKAGRLAVDLAEWHGPPGLLEDYKAAKKANPGAPDRMLTVQLVLFRRGVNWSPAARPETLLDHPQAIAQGPFDGDTELRSLAVLTLASLDEARALVEADPAVRSQALKAEVHGWMVSDGVFPKRK